MMKTATVIDPQIHELVVAETARQIKLHSERRAEIVNERARLYGSISQKGAAPSLDPDEKAAREHAGRLLNGNAPAELTIPPEISRDRELLREQRGIDIAIKILGSKEVVARAAWAVSWAETNAPAWHELCRGIILTAIRLDALERRAQQLLEQCPDVAAVRLPLINAVGGRAIAETPLNELVERALSENVITPAEKRKAENV